MYRHNSTIRIKQKACSRCGHVRPIFSRNRCKECSTIEDTLARMEKETDDEIQGEAGLPDLIKEADEVFSKWLRKSYADKSGFLCCYTCDERMRWQAAHAGHYIKRGNLYLRFDPRNLRPQGECCNIYLNGNYPEFTRRLEAEHPGITEILTQEAAIAYKPTRQEIRNIITEYRIKFKQL